MSKTRQILRLHSKGRSKLLIAQQTSVSRNTLKKYLKKFELSGHSFNEANELGDKDLEDLFIKPEERPVTTKLQTLCSLFSTMDKELKHKGVTRLLLWEESVQKLLCSVECAGKYQYAHRA